MTQENVSTIGRYCELKNLSSTHKFPGIFYAFSNEQFEQGYNSILPLREGEEKLVSIGYGCYGWRKYIDQMLGVYNNLNKLIKNECNPQDVYDCEYNDYECCISYNGDKEAIELVIDIYGYDIARTIQRKRPYMTIDQLQLNETKLSVQGLTFNGGEIPTSLWFDNDGKCFTMSNCALYSVMKNGKQYKSRKKLIYGLCAKYKNGKIFDFYKE